MKSGLTITEMAHELRRRQDAKRDFLAPTRGTKLVIEDATLRMHFGGHSAAVSNHTHSQIAAYTGIPKIYYDKMLREKPELLATNANEWLHSTGDKRLIRTLDGTARAFLSDRYRPLENEDLAEAVLPVLEQKGVVIWSAYITDRKFYIKAVDEKIVKHVPKGHRIGDGGHAGIVMDELCPAITISNSEVGDGSLSVLTSVFTKACTNLATFNDRSIRRTHVGGRLAADEQLYAMLSDETRRVSDQALWLQVRDVVANAFDEARFTALAEQIAASADDAVPAEAVTEVVELTGKKLGLIEPERKSVLKHLIEGGDLSRYGLFNAVTRTAEDVPDYDRASELERLGGQIIELGKREWKELVDA